MLYRKEFLLSIVFASFLIASESDALTVAGITFPDNGFADEVISTNASASHFVTGDPQVVVTAAFAITGSNQVKLIAFAFLLSRPVERAAFSDKFALMD